MHDVCEVCVPVEVRGLLGKGILSFHHMDLRNQNQVFRSGGKCLYPLSHLPAPKKIGSSYFHCPGYSRFAAWGNQPPAVQGSKGMESRTFLSERVK